MSTGTTHHAACLDCSWTADGPRADRAAERHTRSEQHTTTARSVPDGSGDGAVVHTRTIWLRAGDARAALDEHPPVYSPESGGVIVCGCGDTLDYRDHVIGVLDAATTTPRTAARRTAAERRLDIERDT